jgi:hypothetical protein
MALAAMSAFASFSVLASSSSSMAISYPTGLGERWFVGSEEIRPRTPMEWLRDQITEITELF